MEFITIVIYLSIYIGLVATAFYILSFLSYSQKERPMYKDSELPKVTVLIPAYNEAKTIGKTINSILKSNYPDFEVIVIENGSTDKTYELAKKFESLDDRVRVFHNDKSGKGRALNFGLKKAGG